MGGKKCLTSLQWCINFDVKRVLPGLLVLEQTPDDEKKRTCEAFATDVSTQTA